ncbi:glycerol dehydrogenase [Synechococcus sp. Tobar12-5m-g]|uniref:glycerol dehydrogenase n=1 Tax=unclassified Synechococcus TaxID=2626047 RepID=UPI0020CFA8B9|nr:MULTISPECIES: glycerol dehydrogenase [unclassified Synechococcus]MCP9771643.1 glycerol dehydrogenase [Synechococcus sp. Tobar12-5m-g]MCP9872584.1 glycerol dehydrogenase [Synechococcus sp. Cruz CV-v-12]
MAWTDRVICMHHRPLAVFASPGRYVQGPGATWELGRELERLGLEGPILFIAAGTARRELQPIWEEVLPPVGLWPTVIAFGGECSVAEIDRLVAAGSGQPFCAVVGAGGGKTSDTVRAVADQLQLPAVITPTLASTDSPCSALSVVYTKEGAVEGFRFFNRHPLLVLVDTEVVARAPRRQLVSGIGDALATWFEARTVRQSHKTNAVGGLPTTTGTALAKLCCDILLADGPAACAAVDAQVTSPALERLVEANNLLSGLGFESGGLAVAHAVHNGISELPGSHGSLHGEKVAFGLHTQLVLEGQPQSEVMEILRYCRAVGLPTTLAEVGIDADDENQVRTIATRSVIPGETSHNEPFAVTATAVVAALRAADRLGRTLA